MRKALLLGALPLLALLLWLAIQQLGSTPDRSGTPAPSGGDDSAARNPQALLRGAEEGRAQLDSAGGGAPDPASAETIDPGEPEPTVEPAGSVLAGLVVDAGTREALADMLLGLELEGEESLEVRTDAAGHFEAGPRVWPQEVLVRHLAEPSTPRFEAPWEVEPRSLHLDGEEPRAEVVIAARRPDLVIEIRVRGTDAAPIHDALVHLIEGWRDRDGGFHSRYVAASEYSDTDGRALFSLNGELARSSSLRVQTRHWATGVWGRSLFIDPPLQRGPWTIELQPPGSLRVVVRDREGAALAEGSVSIISAEVVEAAMGLGGERVVNGEALADSLGAGLYRVRVTDHDSGDHRVERVEIQPGVETRLEVSFADGETALAVAGRVLDAQGQPLEGVSLWFEQPGVLPDILMTAADGTFRRFARRSESVVVGTHGDVLGDRLEPERLRVPFGTEDVELRLVELLERVQLVFAVSDAASGEPLDGGAVYVLRGTPRGRGGWEVAGIARGEARVEVPDRDDLRYRVEVEGYRYVEAPLPGDRGEAVRVALTPGFECRLEIVDARSGEPLAGARLFGRQGVEVARSDGDGLVQLRSHAWPEDLRVHLPGYGEKIFVPGQAEFLGDRVSLDPLP